MTVSLLVALTLRAASGKSVKGAERVCGSEMGEEEVVVESLDFSLVLSFAVVVAFLEGLVDEGVGGGLL